MPTPLPTPTSTRAVTAAARKILDERNTRKAAEQNAQLLSNRIQHLKDEVVRASRRAEEASRRKKEIIELKKEADKRRDVIKMRREGREKGKKLDVKEEGFYGTWVPGGKHLKVDYPDGMDAAEISRLIKKREEDILKKNRSKIAEIRKREEDMAKKKRMEEEKRIKALRDQFRKKMEAEKKKREEAESVVNKLEEEEMRLIEVLRKTQQVQANAYEGLKETIVGGEEKKEE